MSARKLQFGTDGIRGPAGEWPLTEAGVHRIGLAMGNLLPVGAKVVVGRDTRESGAPLASALCRGLADGGALAMDAGVLPTAAVSCAVVHHKAAAGVALTASHNPWTDNGLKVLDDAGAKGFDHAALEARFHDAQARPGGTPIPLADGDRAWRDAMPKLDLTGVRLLLDCAHGAAAPFAPALLRSMGATLSLRGCAPDGQNINAGVGALHPPTAAEVQAAGCDLALCLDGDADRIQLVDPRRGLLDGDDLLWLCADETGAVVGTVMSNGGLGQALGGRLVRAAVGDKNVALAMAQHGARVGAEPSGHVLFADGLPTGDGLYTALRVLSCFADDQHRPKLPLPAGGWSRWPVASTSVRFDGPRSPLDQLSTPAAAEAAGNRVVVRYSGTEPKLRILVEGPAGAPEHPQVWADRIRTEFLAT